MSTSGIVSLPKLTKGERTRLQILERSIECFVKHGFDGASYTELARLCEVNRGLFFHYFDSKQKLIEAALGHVGANLRGFTDEFMIQRDDISDIIERYVDATFEWARLHPAHAGYLMYCIQRGMHDPTIGRAVQFTFHRAWERLEGMIQGRYIVSSPMEAGQQVHASVVGTVLLSLTMGGATVEMYRRQCKLTARQVLGQVHRGGRRRPTKKNPAS